MAAFNLALVRVLVVGAKGQTGPLMRTVLTAAGLSKVILVEEPRRALELLCTEPFDAVFVEAATRLDDVSFALAARRSSMLLNPMIPIFAVYSGARRRDVEQERDDGVTDVICRPVSPKTIADKLRVALAAPRPFIAASDFFGPDRRAKERPWRGDDRRTRAPKKVKVILNRE
jgi:two-component system chemotaxis response regulator CheY